MKQKWAAGLTTRIRNMASRLSMMILLCTAGLAMTSEAWAQQPGMNGYHAPQQIMLPSWNEADHWNSLPVGAGQPVATSYNANVVAPPRLPAHMQPPGPGPHPGYSYFDGSTITSVANQYDDANDPWAQPSEFEKFVYAAAKESWFRADYLFWSMDAPGNAVVGHDRYFDFLNTGVREDPRSPVVYVDDLATPNEERFAVPIYEPNFLRDLADPSDDIELPLLVATSRALDLEGISFQEKSGFRGTIGIPFTFGEFQASGWLVGQASDDTYGNDSVVEIASSVPGPFSTDIGYIEYYRLPKYYNLPVTLNGSDTTPLVPELVYEDMRVQMTNNVWGADAKVLIDLEGLTPQYGFVYRPVIGGMYLAIHEKIRTDAVRSDDYFVWDPYADTFGELHMTQDSYNNIYGATVGLNVEYRTPYVTFGAEPKGLIGFNSYRTRIKTQDLAFAGEEYFIKESKTEFSPLLDMQVYMRANLTENLSFFLAYDLKYASKVARPHNQTRYDVLGSVDYNTGLASVDETNFSISSHLDEFKIDGLTIGAEFYFH